LLADTTVKDR